MEENTEPKTGTQLIAQERAEQIEKHGFDVRNDAYYCENELIKAALFAINPFQFEWPFYWHEDFRKKILRKTRVQRLTVAGALIAAEIDRSLYSNSQLENADFKTLENDIETIGHCANCGVEYHIHK